MKNPSTHKKVPSNLAECFQELKKILSTEELAEFKAQTSESQGTQYHESLGR